MKVYKTIYIVDGFRWGVYFNRIENKLVLGKDALEYNFYNYRQISSRGHSQSFPTIIGDL